MRQEIVGGLAWLEGNGGGAFRRATYTESCPTPHPKIRSSYYVSTVNSPLGTSTTWRRWRGRSSKPPVCVPLTRRREHAPVTARSGTMWPGDSWVRRKDEGRLPHTPTGTCFRFC